MLISDNSQIMEHYFLNEGVNLSTVKLFDESIKQNQLEYFTIYYKYLDNTLICLQLNVLKYDLSSFDIQ